MDCLPDDLITHIFSNFLSLKEIAILYILNYYKIYNIKYILEKQQMKIISESIYKKCERFSKTYKLKENFEGRTVIKNNNSLIILESFGKHPISNYFYNIDPEEINKLIFNCKRFAHLKEQNRLKKIRLKYLKFLGTIFSNIVLQISFFKLSKYFKNYIIKYLFEFLTSIFFLRFIINCSNTHQDFMIKWNIYFYTYFEYYLNYKIHIEICHYFITNLILMYFLFYSDFVN